MLSETMQDALEKFTEKTEEALQKISKLPGYKNISVSVDLKDHRLCIQQDNNGKKRFAIVKTGSYSEDLFVKWLDQYQIFERVQFASKIPVLYAEALDYQSEIIKSITDVTDDLEHMLA